MVNSKLKQCNKPTFPPWKSFDLNRFKENLFKFSSPHYTEFVPGSVFEAKEARETALKKIGELENALQNLALVEAFSSDLIIFKELDQLRMYLRNSSLEKHFRTPMKKAGRPQVNGRVAMILLSALHMASGNRKIVDEIGKFIALNGELQIRLNKRYGEGSFERLNFPSVNFFKDRWDANVKDQLRPAAEHYLKRSAYMKYLTKTDANEAERRLNSMIERAHWSGYTDTELSEMEYEP